MEEYKASAGGGEEGGYVGCCGWVGIDVFEVSVLDFVLARLLV